MKRLAENKCEVCRTGAPLVTTNEIKELAIDIPDWKIVRVGGMRHLTRSFCFNNFVESLSFTNDVGAIAEAEGHHPSILTEYRLVTVSWWTHVIDGLHRNDFIMAAKTDELYIYKSAEGHGATH